MPRKRTVASIADMEWAYNRLDHLLTVFDEGCMARDDFAGPGETMAALRKVLPVLRARYGFEKAWPNGRVPMVPLRKYRTKRLGEARASLKVERKQIATLTNALRAIQLSYGVRGPDEHPTDAGGDSIPAPDCYCPFCVSTRALRG